MSRIIELATGRLTGTETTTVELIETDETPAVVIVRWTAKPTLFHLYRFPAAANVCPYVRGRYDTAGNRQAGSTAVRPQRRTAWTGSGIPVVGDLVRCGESLISTRRVPVNSGSRDLTEWDDGLYAGSQATSLNQSVMAKSVKSNRSGLPFVSTILSRVKKVAGFRVVQS